MKAFSWLLISYYKSFLRDRFYVFFTLLLPVLFMGLFGLLFSGEGTSKIDLGLVVEDESPAVQAVEQAFSSLEALVIHRGEREAELEALKKGKRRAVLVIPEGLSPNLTQAKPGEVLVYYDPSQAVGAQVILSIVRQVLGEMNKRLTGRPDVLVAKEISIQVEHLRSIDYLVPGILAMAIMWLGLFSMSSLVVSRQNLVLKRLGATPLPRYLLVGSHTVYQVSICFVQAALIIVLGRLWFQVHVLGNWALLAGLVVLGGLTFISIGFVIASFARTEESFVAITQVVNFPMMFLSGIFFSVEMMPSFLKPVMKTLPLTYLGDALRQVMIGGAPLYALSTDALVLAGWLAVCLAISFRFFRWE